ncbi:hypothetical protein A20C1_07703 [marine actinobacterium PHSC20C1]|nr:hypothetical protein A20C1_07703 [marine actinobacterium PHSC20C1]
MTEHNPASVEASDSGQSDSGQSDSGQSDSAVPALSAPASAAAPVAAPAAARRRLPGWAWGLIIGVPLLLFMAAGAGLVLIGLVASASSEYAGCDDDGYCGLGAGRKSTPSATGNPVDAASPTNRVTLDGNAVFDGQPVWSFTLEPTWQAFPFDQDGINVFQDRAAGCRLITSQSLALPDPEALSDIEASSALLSREIEGLTAGDPEALILNRGATDIAIAVVGSDSTLEFASATIDQTSPEGVAKSTEIAVRSMPDSESELVAALTCDTAAFEAFGSKFELFSKALAVSVSP